MNARLLFALAMLAVVPACAGAGRPAVVTWDTPIPAAEARATVRVTIDLEAATDCDERFDLALYEDRAIERVSWDLGHGCSARHLEVRYLPGRVTKEAVLRRMRTLSRKVNEG